MDWISDPAWWALAVSAVGTLGNTAWNWLNWKQHRRPAYCLESHYAQYAHEKGMCVLSNKGRRTVNVQEIYADKIGGLNLRVGVATNACTTLAPGGTLLYHAVAYDERGWSAVVQSVLVKIAEKDEPFRVQTCG